MFGGMFLGKIVPMLHPSLNVWVRQRRGQSFFSTEGCNMGCAEGSLEVAHLGGFSGLDCAGRWVLLGHPPIFWA